MLLDSSRDIVRQPNVKFAFAVFENVNADKLPTSGEILVAGAGFEPAAFRL